MEKIFVKLSFFVSLLLLLFITVFSNAQYVESENRKAAAFSFASPDAYFTDRFPFREKLLKLNKSVLLFFGINEFSGAFLGKNGYIFSNEDVNINTLEKNLSAAETFGGLLCIVPSKTDALVSLLPNFFDGLRGGFWESAAKCTVYLPDVFSLLRLEGANGKYIYYRADHHLTSLGSYYLYKSLASALGYEAYEARDFVPSVVKTDFSGTDARKMLVSGGDNITLFRYAHDGEFVTENVDTGKRYSGLYDYGKLKTNDPYGIFPIPNAGRVRIFKEGETRKKLLLVCDSYGDSLAPFLARHFDVEMIDPRYYGGSLEELKKENDKILLCFGMDTLASVELLYKLNF